MGQEFGCTLINASCFLCGAVLAWKAKDVARVYHQTPRWLKCLCLGLVVTGYYANKASVAPLACCGILIFARHSRISHLLDTAVPEYLGRISYSMYLLHATVLWATLILLYGKVPFFALFLIYGAATFAISHVFCMFVEEPAMRFGKRATAKKQSVLHPTVSLAVQ